MPNLEYAYTPSDFLPDQTTIVTMDAIQPFQRISDELLRGDAQDSLDNQCQWAVDPNDPDIRDSADQTVWDQLVNFPDLISRSQTPSAPLATITNTINQVPVSIEPAQEPQPSPPPPMEDDLLAYFESNVAPMISLRLPFQDLFRKSTTLRMAALALSATLLRCGNNSQGLSLGSQADCHYYDFALRDLNHQFRYDQKRSAENLFGTAMLLLYRDCLVGSAVDVRDHLCKLETLAARLDLSSFCTPTLLRSWRMMAVDMKMRTMPTRKSLGSTLSLPQHGILADDDGQLALREVFSSAWALHSRFIMEASFREVAGISSSPSWGDQQRQQSTSCSVVQWLCSIVGRQCDLHQLQQGDYHEEELTSDIVRGECALFERRLDDWYSTLQHHEKPMLRLGTADDVIAGPSFGSILLYDLQDEFRALDYMTFLVARMICSHLLYQAAQDDGAETTPASVTQAWGWVVLGIAAATGLQRQHLYGPGVHTLLLLTAFLSEGSTVASAILDGIIPRARVQAQASGSLATAELATLRRQLELLIPERHRGKAIRAMISGFDEHEKLEKLHDSRYVVAFGDYNGKGHFRQVYQIPRP